MIRILDDESCEMLRIEKDGQCIFEGNYWDVQQSPTGISDLLDSLGVTHTLEDYEYDS